LLYARWIVALVARARFLLYIWQAVGDLAPIDLEKGGVAMHPLMSALSGLAPIHDPELMEGYERYVALLETILTPAQLDTYAALIQRTGAIQIFDELAPEEMASLTPDEMVIATTIMSDEAIAMENRRVAALLGQRGELAAAELGDSSSSPARSAASTDAPERPARVQAP
jgi:hypothetical protein